MIDDQVDDAFDVLQYEISSALGTLCAEVVESGETRYFAAAAKLSRQAPADRGNTRPDSGTRSSMGRDAVMARPRSRACSGWACRWPIAGAHADVSDALDEVERRMGQAFIEADRRHLPLRERYARWRNTAQWTRNSPVQAGLTERPWRRGVWEISEVDRKWLASGAEWV